MITEKSITKFNPKKLLIKPKHTASFMLYSYFINFKFLNL